MMGKPTELRTLMDPFATAIWAKVEAMKALPLTPRQKSRLSESISDDIKKASTFHPHKMSKRAHEKASSLPNPPNLAEMTWHEQQSFDPGRELFIVEHRATVSSLKQRCLAASTRENVLDVLEKGIEIVWLLREEDDVLTELKYRSSRPESAYDEAKIDLWNGEN